MVDESQVWAALRTVLDRGSELSVVDRGLVLGVWIHDGGVRVELGYATPAPIGPPLGEEAERAIRKALPSARSVAVREVRRTIGSRYLACEGAQEDGGPAG